ncbi:MAG: hypothetical protein JWO27_2986 [Frankiales bacterium]|nr:hypothetical protein [Frankiales bacterium]
MLPQGLDVEWSVDPEGPWERSATVSEVDAGRVRVHGGATTRQATGGVGGEDTVDHDDTQQGWLRVAGTAPHTGADRTLDGDRRQVYS